MLKNIHTIFLNNCEEKIKFELDKFYKIDSLKNEDNYSYLNFTDQIKELSDSEKITSNGFFIPGNTEYRCRVFFFDNTMRVEFNINKKITNDFSFQLCVIHNLTKDKYSLRLGVYSNLSYSAEQLYVCYNEDFKITSKLNHLRELKCKMPPNTPRFDENCIFYRNDIVEVLFNNYSDLNKYLSLLALQFDFKKNDNDILLDAIVQSVVTVVELNKSVEKKPKLVI